MRKPSHMLYVFDYSGCFFSSFFQQTLQPRAKRWSETRSVPSAKWPKCSLSYGESSEGWVILLHCVFGSGQDAEFFLHNPISTSWMFRWRLIGEGREVCLATSAKTASVSFIRGFGVILYKNHHFTKHVIKCWVRVSDDEQIWKREREKERVYSCTLTSAWTQNTDHA